MGTMKGLNRYDGYTFKAFRRQVGDTTGLPPNIIRTMAEDRLGNLWIGMDGNGLLYFDPYSGRYTTYRHNPANPHSLAHNDVYFIHQDQTGFIWAGTYGAAWTVLIPGLKPSPITGMIQRIQLPE